MLFQGLGGVKMNWKNRLTNYNFWISIISAVLLILQAFKINFDIACINEIVTAVLGLLVVIGIVSDPTKTATKVETKTETKSEPKAEKVEAVTMPTDEQNADNPVDSQNDFKDILAKISQEVEQSFKVLEKMSEKKVEADVTVSEKKIEEPDIATVDNQESLHANENPYIDVM